MKKLNLPPLQICVMLLGLSGLIPGTAQAATDCNAVTEIPLSECQALLDLYNSTDGPNWSDAASNNWNVTNTPCSWEGVSCSGGHVTKLLRMRKNLTGTLPDLPLPALTFLDLSYNQLSGSIPDFSKLPALISLWLPRNQLSGEIPDFSNFPVLLDLDLSSNQLSGGIPDFSKLPALTDLKLSFNQLSGSIPDFSKLPALEYLSLNSNQLGGGIPDFSKLPALISLTLSRNQLGGSIPDFSNLQALRRLDLSDGQLSGGIPDFSKLPALTSLSLSRNQLSGSIPDFSKLPALTSLSLPRNQLSGSIPDFSKLPALTDLYLSDNQLSGSIPDFSNFPALKRLSLSNNQLSGSIPDFSKLPALTVLDLPNNQLSGGIPDFSRLLTLTGLTLRNNQLSGVIPDFSRLPALTYLSLSVNQLSGNIPNFSKLPALTDLSLSDNQLNGSIPDFNKLFALKRLYLDNNQLSGTIPNFTAFSLSELRLVYFGKNCGLTAYDATQEAVLTQKDPTNWQSENPNCGKSLRGVILQASGTGKGTISGYGNYTAGETVSLSATPAADSVFSGWAPAPCADSFAMPDNQLSCTAVFTLAQAGHSQCSVYKAQQPNVVVPCVSVGGTVYSANMNIIPAPAGILRFEVDSTSIMPVPITPAEQCAVYPFGAQSRLRINCVEVNGESLWAELTTVPHPAAIQFDLAGSGVR